MAGLLRLVVAFVAVLTAALAEGITPRTYTDDELAQFPQVVVAYWPGGPAKPQVGNADKGSEQTIVVTQVLGGTIRRGRVRVMCGNWIDWSGKRDQGFFDGAPLPPVHNFHRLNVWFLKGGKGGQPYLLESIYCVQPLNLVPLYRALRPADRNERVGSCLESRDPEVVSRALTFVDGDKDPWPLENGLSRLESTEEGKPLAGQMGRVRDVALGRLSGCRAEAAAVYAKGMQGSSVGVLRRLLDDRDPQVQAVAAAWLVRLDDTREVSKIAAVLGKIEDSGVACQTAQAAGRSRDTAYVPALIQLLDNHMLWFMLGTDLHVPSSDAQKALRSLTGVVFPFDVAASDNAWRAVEGLDLASRAEKLKAILGDWDEPLVATYLLLPGKAKFYKGMDGRMLQVTVRNRTDHPVVVENRPASFDCSVDNGEFGGSVREPGNDQPTRLVSLAAGGAIRFKMVVEAEPLWEKTKPVIQLEYTDEDLKFNRSHWVGIVAARSGR
jgi:hypothetical protein